MANPRAGQPAEPDDLVDLPHLVTAYYSIEPDPDDVAQGQPVGSRITTVLNAARARVPSAPPTKTAASSR